MTTTFKDLLDRIQQTGRPVTVEFVKPSQDNVKRDMSVEDLESYAEAGMRAAFTGGYVQNHDDVVVFEVDYAPFDEHNRAFESPNYYDKQMKPCLTARQAGYYKPQDTLYLTGSQAVDNILKVIEDGPVLALYQAWKDQGGDQTYVSFLEQRVLAHDPAFAPAAPAAPARRTSPRS